MAEKVGRVEYELGVDMRKLKTGFSDAEKQARTSGKRVESAWGKGAAGGIGKANKQAQGFGATMSKLKGSVKGGILGGLGLGVGFGATLAIAKGFQVVTGAIGDMVRSAIDFDQAMTESLAIMGDVSDEMRSDMERAARDVAKTTTFSAREAAEAYYFLASAGLDAQKSVAAMPRVAAFAQAGMFDLATATDLLTDAQSALGLSSEDTAENLENMTYVSDALIKANTLANASAQQFSEALTNRGAQAIRLYGQELEDGLALLALWADQGVKGAEAGTRLDIVLRDLTTTASKNADAYADLGIAVFDSNGNLRSSTDIIADLDDALAGMSDRTVNATLRQLGFQQRTVSATASLLGGTKKLRAYRKEMDDLAGTTDEVANRQLQSLSAKLDILGNKAEVLGQKIGEHIIGPLEGVVEVIGFAIDALDALGDASANVDELVFAQAELKKIAHANGVSLEQLGKAFEDTYGRVPLSLREVLVAVDRVSVAHFLLNAEVIRTAGGLDKLGKSAGDVADEFESAEDAARAFDDALDAFAAVPNLDVIERRIKNAKRDMRQALKEGNEAKWARKADLLEELRDQRTIARERSEAFAEAKAEEKERKQAARDARREQEKPVKVKLDTVTASEQSEQMKEDWGLVTEEKPVAEIDDSLALASIGTVTTDWESALATIPVATIDPAPASLSISGVQLQWQAVDDFVPLLNVDISAAEARINRLRIMIAQLGSGVTPPSFSGLTGGGGVGGNNLNLPTAVGGWRAAGSLSMVGEHGPELRIEPSSAMYVNAAQTQQLIAGLARHGNSGGVTVNVNAGAFLGFPNDAQRLGRELTPIIKRELGRLAGSP